MNVDVLMWFFCRNLAFISF